MKGLCRLAGTDGHGGLVRTVQKAHAGTLPRAMKSICNKSTGEAPEQARTCTMSAIWRLVCAVLARALSVSFLLLASTILLSSILHQARNKHVIYLPMGLQTPSNPSHGKMP